LCARAGAEFQRFGLVSPSVSFGFVGASYFGAFSGWA
jgi:hypothetical protein